MLTIISNFGLSSDGGGVKVYTQNLVSALREKGINVNLLIREGTPTEIEEELPDNKLIYIVRATRMLNKLKPELILSQGGWFTAIPAVLYKKKNQTARAIYIYHTHYDKPENLTQTLIRKIENLIMSFVLSRFDYILFVSRGLRKNVEENGVLKTPPNWGVLYGAFSLELPAKGEVEKFKREFKINESDIYLLGLGLTALSGKAKGAKLLIDSLKYLPNNVKLILTRRGAFIGELKKYAKVKGVNENVIFTGDLKNPHVATLVADMYTHITYGEGGLSLALLEVMSIGKPIVASRVGGIPEAIRHPLEGSLVENTSKDITNAILKLIESPKLRKKMTVISKRAVLKRFSWEKTVDRLLMLFGIHQP